MTSDDPAACPHPLQPTLRCKRMSLLHSFVRSLFSHPAVFRILLTIALVVSGTWIPGSAEEPQGWFEFGMSAVDDRLDFLVDGDVIIPAGQPGRVTVNDGHFVDGNGARIRFIGTNLCFGGAFPDKTDATAIAKRLGQLGVNVVRFHHMDNASAPRGIWDRGRKRLDADQLDRLDWLIAQLKQNGIYSNLNLHVSRDYPDIDRSTERAFRYGKALDNFYAPYIQLQKQYAKDLLTHRNPYTGTTYVDEPAILCVEINNENSLTTAPWDSLADLGEPWGPQLQKQWNRWLAARYDDIDQARRAWGEVDEPLGAPMLAQPAAGGELDAWNLQAPAPAEATIQISQDAPEGESFSIHCELTRPGSEEWHFQLNQRGLSLEAGRLYTFSFWAKSDRPRTVRPEARLAIDPWDHLGLQTAVQLTSRWQRFDLPFRATESHQDVCRVGWVMGNDIGSVWFSGASLRPGGVLGTAESQSIAEGNVRLTRRVDTVPRQRDYLRFLMDTEQRYHVMMRDFLKLDLGLRAMVINTQASYGKTAGILRESRWSDFIDMHGYWQHPRFPGRPWDPSNWTIENTSMIGESDGGRIGLIARHRVAAMPFSVSEYNHPAPNESAVEMFPILSSVAAMQDWDAIYQFSYMNSSEAPEVPRIDSYFELANHPGHLVWLPIAKQIFRQGGVHPLATSMTLQIPTDATHADASISDHWSAAAAQDDWLMKHRLQVKVGDTDTPVIRRTTVTDATAQTSQVRWQPGDNKGGGPATFVVNAPTVRAAVGQLADRTIKLGDVSLIVRGLDRKFASFGLASLDNRPIETSKRMLLVLVGRVENTGMRWNESRTSVGTDWGDAPTIAEGISASVVIPGKVNVKSLSASGEPQTEVPVRLAGDRSGIQLGPKYKTLWYLIQRP
ncbi:Carbohydrate binding domain protein [Crateriforma conspicua]|uniref:mannan endo-1,4-beta-mannosidase n=2 Tax=Planctomycetaceae TaxID=126 RepID=A0A5C6FP51_9PLAN|nr:Carbohydrate binding domain protein [Crateriforma conspicua]